MVMAGFAVIATTITINRISGELDAKLSNYLRISVVGLAAPLWNFDHNIVEGYLDSLMLDKTIVFVNVLSADGTVLNRAVPTVKDITFEELQASGDYSALHSPVMREGKKIGSIELVVSREVIQSEIKSNILAIVALTLFFLITITGVSVAISRRYVARPLARLQQSAAAIGGGNLKTEIDISGDDEVGVLAREFDGMRNSIGQLVNELEDANEQLENANHTLEDRVEERTREVVVTQQKLVDAIESTSEGFAFFNAEDLLVLHNAQYEHLLYSGTDVKIEPGMSFEHILRLGIEHGLIADDGLDEEAFIKHRLEQHANPQGAILQRRGNDLWLQISERKTGDGGTVAVFSNVSDLKSREADLTEKTATLEHLSNQLAKYLSPQIYESIFQGRQEVRVTSSRKKLTVFFSDIEGFTETAEQMESEELTILLNNYLTEMSNIALEHGATIDKYIGDAILIFFGDPETRGVKQDAIRCVEMAIAMSKRMTELRAEWASAGILNPLRIRMGIHTDYCTVGNFGSESRMDYTIIGRGVNTAARLETAADPDKILMSFATHAQIGDEIPCVSRGQIEVKGIAKPLEVYEVLMGEMTPVEDIFVARTDDEKLQLDLEGLTTDERDKFEHLLKDLLSKIPSGDRPGQ
jgi:class 3 adenylate cyclase/HAMP domain-containing protein